MWTEFEVCDYYVRVNRVPGEDPELAFRVKARSTEDDEIFYLTPGLERSSDVNDDFRGTIEDCEEFINRSKGELEETHDHWNDHE